MQKYQKDLDDTRFQQFQNKICKINCKPKITYWKPRFPVFELYQGSHKIKVVLSHVLNQFLISTL